MRLKPKTPMEHHSAEQPDAVLADLEAKHGSAPTPLLAGEQKCPVCHDLGIIRNDHNGQGWEDCPHCEAKIKCPCCWEMVYPQKIRMKETGQLVCNKCHKCGGTWA